MQVILRLSWKTKEPGGKFPSKLLYQQMELPYVPRVGESVQLWGEVWREVTAVRVHRREGTFYPELDFGDYPAFVRPEEAQKLLETAREDGWGEEWPPDIRPTPGADVR